MISFLFYFKQMSGMAIPIRIRDPPFFSCKTIHEGNFMEVKCFVICTDLLPLKGNFSYFKIQIFMLSKLESESGESEFAMQKICNIIRNPPIFLPDCHPWIIYIYILQLIVDFNSEINKVSGKGNYQLRDGQFVFISFFIVNKSGI